MWPITEHVQPSLGCKIIYIVVGFMSFTFIKFFQLYVVVRYHVFQGCVFRLMSLKFMSFLPVYHFFIFFVKFCFKTKKWPPCWTAVKVSPATLFPLRYYKYLKLSWGKQEPMSETTFAFSSWNAYLLYSKVHEMPEVCALQGSRAGIPEEKVSKVTYLSG